MIDAIIKLLKTMFGGSTPYKIWLAFLLLVTAVGAYFVYIQIDEGLIATNMRDQVSWGWYIANFTFLVGVAAAAVVLVIPAYIYKYKPIKDIVLIGEIMAVSAVTMCLLFVVLDMGAPEKFWHLIPFIGYFNFPQSILAWDVLVLNVYLALNLFLVFYAIWKMYKQEEYNHKLMWPFILFSIPAAISIHTVTAFIYAGLGARPFWNAAILAPRFIASAFCSGPAFMLIIFQIIRKRTTFEISDKALLKISEIITFAMAFNLFLLGSEIFKEVYSDSQHIAALHYLYTGLHGHDRLVPWIWSAMAFNLTAFGILIIPSLRKNFTTLNIACVLIFAGVYIEKGIGLVFPGFIPSTMGDIYEYFPNTLEIMISLGIWAFGLLIFTILTKIALAVKSGELRCSCTETKSR